MIKNKFSLGQRVIISRDEFVGDEVYTNMILNYNCSNCSETNKVNIIPYNTGRLLDEICSEEKALISKDELIMSQAAFRRPRSTKHLSEMVIMNLHARYELLKCENCKESHILIFAFGESQPSRVICKITGVWNIAAE